MENTPDATAKSDLYNWPRADYGTMAIRVEWWQYVIKAVLVVGLCRSLCPQCMVDGVPPMQSISVLINNLGSWRSIGCQFPFSKDHWQESARGWLWAHGWDDDCKTIFWKMEELEAHTNWSMNIMVAHLSWFAAVMLVDIRKFNLALIRCRISLHIGWCAYTCFIVYDLLLSDEMFTATGKYVQSSNDLVYITAEKVHSMNHSASMCESLSNHATARPIWQNKQCDRTSLSRTQRSRQSLIDSHGNTTHNRLRSASQQNQNNLELQSSIVRCVQYD
jgi:hypothetical protein